MSEGAEEKRPPGLSLHDLNSVAQLCYTVQMTNKSEPLHVRLTFKQMSVLSTVAVRRDIKVSELVREILDRWTDSQLKREAKKKA